MIKRKYINIFKCFIFLIIVILSKNLALSEVTDDSYEIQSEKVKYLDNNIVIAEGNAVAKNKNKIIYSDKIVYEKNKNLITTFGNSIFQDGKNILRANYFTYNLKSKKISAKENVILEDQSKNKFFFKTFEFYEEKEIGNGENIKSYFIDGSYIESEKGKFDKKKGLSTLKNAKYTTCKKIKNQKDQFCPSWSIHSKEVEHNKDKKNIVHKNAFIKIKNIPILYSPYFSHPDPTVDRQSGFLPPAIKTLSNIGKTIRVPYFWAISDDKDLTITPILYLNENSMINTSYRQAFKNGVLNFETSYTQGYKKLDKDERTKGSRNYFFLDYKGKNKNLLFENNDINFKIQRISQQNYTRVHGLNTNLFKQDIRNLENSIKLSSYENNKRLEIKTGIFENLNVTSNEKYTYFFPDAQFYYNTKLFRKFNTNFVSLFNAQKFSNNQKKGKVLNNINIDQNPFIIKKLGLSSNFKVSIYNKNIYNKKIENQKNNSKINNNLSFAIDNNYPLVKFSKKNYQTFTPRFFLKHTIGGMQDASGTSKIFNYHDAFSMNRINNLENIETGTSLGHGFEYIFNQNKINTKFKNKDYQAKFGMSQVIRKNTESKMPAQSSFNKKNSDIAGFLNFNFLGDKNKFNLTENEVNKIEFLNHFKNNKLSINYNFNIDNDISKIFRNSLEINTTFNQNNISFKFDEKNGYIGNDRTSTLSYKKYFNDNYFLNFETKKNLKSDASEFHNFSLNFENDCLLTSLTLSRNFYYDKDIKSSSNLIFSIIFKPFSDNIAPDLTNFIN